MNRNSPYLLPLFLFLISLFLRFSLISKGPYSVDCLDLALQSELTAKTFQLHYVYGTGYPMSVVLGALFVFIFKLFGTQDPVTAVNAMSVVFSALAVPVLYLIVKKFLNETAAVFSALLFSVMPTFLGISVYGKNHAPSLFFLLLAIYFLILYTGNKTFRFLLLGGLSTGLLGATRIQDLGVMVPALSLLYFQNTVTDKKNLWKNFFLFWFTTGIITLALHLPYLFRKDAQYYNFQFSEFYQQFFVQNYLGIDPVTMSFGLQAAGINLTTAGLILAVLGLVLLYRQSPRLFWFLLLWFGVSFMFFSNLRTTVERFLVISFIPLTIAQGYALECLSSVNKRFKYASVMIFFMIFSLLLANIYPVLLFRHRYAPLPDFARWVALQTEPNAVIIVGDENLFIEHYGKRKTLAQLQSVYRPISDEQFSRYKENIDRILDQNIPLYITEAGLMDDNPGRQFKKLMMKNYKLVVLGKFPCENWRRGETYQDVFLSHLLRIHKK